MEWFEKHHIKDQQLLTEEQIVYLRKPSLTIFGPFNFLLRKHFDFLFAIVFFTISDLLLQHMNFPLLIEAIYFIVSPCLLLGVFYFFVKHGRRLAWNRNQWKDFEAFQKSETKWFSWAIIGFSAHLFIEFNRDRHEDASNEPGEMIFTLLGVALFCTAVAWPFVSEWWHHRKKQPHLYTEDSSNENLV